MATVRRKISELTALNSASLDTTVLGIDNGTTYKIELDTLADAVTSRVNVLDRSRLSALETFTSSVSVTIPAGTISSSTQITSLGFISSSIDITSLNSYTASQDGTNIAFTNGINSRLTTSSFNSFSESVHVQFNNIDSYNTFQDSRFVKLEEKTGSYSTTSSFNSFSASVHSEIIAATNEQSFNGLISGSSQLTASYDSRYVLSGSITQTTWDNIESKPVGIISSSNQISNFGFVTSSVVTGTPLDYVYLKYGSEISIPESGSYLKPDGSSFGNISYNNSNGYFNLNGNSTYILEANTKLAVANGVALVWYDVTNNRNVPAGNEFWNDTEDQQIVKAIITTSASTQVALKVSYKSGNSTIDYGRSYIFIQKSTLGSGSIGVSSYNDLTDIPVGLVSQSTDLTSLNSFTSSYYTDSASFSSRIDAATNEQSLSHLVTTSSFNSYTASISTASLVDRLNIIENTTSSYETKGSGILSGSISYTSLTNIPSGIISQSVDLTSLNQFTASISTESLVNRLNIIESVSSSWITENETGSFLTSLNGAISSSSQLTASYDTRYTLSGSVSAVPAGTISGSAQITAFGFVSSSTSVPAGTISGSSQLTSSFDGRYVQTGSFNTLTASFNSFTASAQTVTTGSNSFNGTQTITGSLIITTGSFVGSQILANTSSLYLTSGSNMYVQNNGIVEITGSLKVSGSANFNVNVLSVDGRSGDEGGEINLAIPVTNTTLENRVTTDVWQNRYRIFEGSANAKGVFVDLSKAPAGVGGELMWKASGLVNLGVDVTLGDLKARIPSTGNKSLQLSTTTGVTYSVYGSGIYSQAGTVVGTTINASSPLSITSTPTYLASGYNFGTAGATDTWIIMDTSNTISWRITMILGSGFNNNMISIERLV